MTSNIKKMCSAILSLRKEGAREKNNEQLHKTNRARSFKISNGRLFKISRAQLPKISNGRVFKISKGLLRKKTILSALVVASISLFCVAGCSGNAQPAQLDINKDIPEGAPPLMPANHTGRYERMGNLSCLGCHGVSESGAPRLSAAKTPPKTHFENGDPASNTILAGYNECTTCHVQS